MEYSDQGGNKADFSAKTINNPRLIKLKPRSSRTTKKNRLQIRIDASSREILQRAADYARKPLSEFVVANSLSAAERVIEEHDKVVLSDADWKVFFDALNNPPKPNRELKGAFERYKQAKS